MPNTLTFAPFANATETFPSASIQQRRLEVLDTATKFVDDIQKVRLEQLNNQTKAVDDIQKVWLAHSNNQTRAVDSCP
ncbi:hypothetical protein S7335_637 [Synechococcus sp. PCC 7335]|uniref:hypothetical protein n=1 Tax=Synechococcus sp. (strain ATCC 29403 / PCC 7335) TaxID=91464 RepID=UPI00017EBCD9|nr:hypothetical protein [Synechococcus sp. PCC 7335]EDX83457.1 hypothetical protein S7335_637 [Synechococcus sp. PCC 7335]